MKSYFYVFTVLIGLVFFTSCSDSSGSARDEEVKDETVDEMVDTLPDEDLSLPDEELQDDVTESEIEPDSDSNTGFEIKIPGMDSPVEVTVDGNGIKHLLCETDEDCIAAYAYVSANDKFLLMEYFKHASRGTLSEIWCYDDAVEYDFAQRHFMSTPDGTPLEEAVWSKLNPGSKKLIEAYVRGVNAWIADLRDEKNGAKLSAEFVKAIPGVLNVIKDWAPLDVVSLFLSGEQGETGNNLANDPNTAASLEAMGPELFRDIGLNIPASPISIVPKKETTRRAGKLLLESVENQVKVFTKTRDRSSGWSSVLDKLNSSMKKNKKLRDVVPLPNASNNWAISGSFTENGGSIMESDPHGQLNFPTHMYIIEIDSVTRGSGTLHLFGTGLGGPFFLIGRNENIAWGLTTSIADLTDYYEETVVDDGKAVLFKGEKISLVEKSVKINCKGSSPVERTLRWVPHHGPLVEVNDENTKGFSVRWTGHDANRDIDHWFELMRAENAGEALEIARKIEARGNNLVIGDSGGDIAWRPMIKVPKRPWAAEFPPYLPLPGDGTAEWDGYLAASEVPDLYNPEEGYVATANNDFTGNWYDGDPTNDETPYMQMWVAGGARAERIKQFIESADKHDYESMLALQQDSYLWIGANIMPKLLEIAAEDESVISENGVLALNALKVWKYSCPTGIEGVLPESPKVSDADVVTESIGCSTYHAFAIALSENIVNDDCTAAGVTCGTGRIRESLLFNLIHRPEIYTTGEKFWDDQNTESVETPLDIVAKSLDDAAEFLIKVSGDSSEEWTWGSVMTLNLTPTFDSGADYLKQGPYSISGGNVSVNPVMPVATDEGYTHSYGAMLRMVVDFDSSPAKDYWQIPGGIEHHHESIYYDHLLEGYAAGESFVPPFGPENVEKEKSASFTIE